MDAIAVERAVDGIHSSLLGYQSFDAAVLVNVHRATLLRKTYCGQRNEYEKATDTLHNEFDFDAAKIHFFNHIPISDESCIFVPNFE